MCKRRIKYVTLVIIAAIANASNENIDGSLSGINAAKHFWLSIVVPSTMKIATKTDSSVLKANAWHHRVDALSAVVALVGLSGRVSIQGDCKS